MMLGFLNVLGEVEEEEKKITSSVPNPALLT